MMRITSIGKKVLLTGMVVSAMFTATASPMLVAQAAPNDDGMELMGLVEVMPDGGTVGSWVIGGETFEADENTEFDTDDSPLAVDACADVEYEATADGNLALKIEGDDSPDCTDTEDEDEDSEDEESMELMGLVESMPDGGAVGSWVIGGEIFNADENTEIDTDQSLLAVGACAEVEYEDTADGNLALKIEGEDSPDCTDSDEEDETEDTEDTDSTDADGEDADVPDEAGTSDGGTPPNTEGGNAVDTGDVRLMSNMVEAAPDQAPPVEIGNGTEDPNTSEDEDTEDDPEDADDTEDDDEDDTEDDTEEEIHGIIDAVPAGADAPIGTWVIDGVNYVATADTEIEEEHGSLEISAYVGLEFQVVDGVNQLMELETEPAPGEGPNTIAGTIESIGGGVIAANFTASIPTDATANSTWVIGGTEYMIVSTTELDEQQGALSVGSFAQVNSYTDVNGREVATRISGMEMPVQTEFMFLPLVLQHG